MANIVKRGKVWQYEISYKTKDGKYAKERKSGFRTKSEAAAAAAEMEYEMGKGYDPDAKNINFDEYFKNWMELYKKNSVSPVTYKKYLDTLANIKKYSLDVPLSKLTKRKYQEAINKFAETHAIGTTKRLHNHIKSCISEALFEGLILKDFTKNIILTGNSKGNKKEEEKYLSLEEFKRLISVTLENLDVRYVSRYMILLSAATGVRFAEALGLTWDDIDLINNTININKTWDYKLNRGFVPTKNESSNRIIDIDDQIIEILKQYQQDQQEFFSKNNIVNKNNLVFYSAINGPITSNAVNKTLKKLQIQAGIKTPITFHGLRHTHASLLIYEGIDLFVISDRLGHKNIAVTQEVYAHIFNELKEKNKPKIAKAISVIYQ